MKNKIIIAVLCFLLVALVIQISTIKKHNDEIVRLRQRVHNLETVINNDFKTSKPEKKTRPSAGSYVTDIAYDG